jgi:uncharacterized protein with HEPN domain
VGEAASQIPRSVQIDYPQIAWAAIIGMRHRLVHGYEQVDYDIVWEAVEVDLPALIETLEMILASFE